MMSNPQILLLDEPSLGLSPLLCKELFGTLRNVCKTGIGILLVEQNAKQGLAIADRAYLLENGSVVRHDTPDALASDLAVQKAYLGAQGAAAPTLRASGRKDAVRDSLRAAGSTMVESSEDMLSPARIAAQAMEAVSNRPPQALARPMPPSRATGDRPKEKRPHAIPATPSTIMPRPEKHLDRQASGADRMAAPPHDINIGELVERAGARTAESLNLLRSAKGRYNGGGNGAVSRERQPALPEIPRFEDQGDRLRQVLSEIEEAAARARLYRPPARKE